MTDLERFDHIAREQLSEHRYRHSVCVMEQARWLARCLGADEEKAAIAGILHDICKEMPHDGQLQYLTTRGILLSEIQKQAKAALHGLTASVWVREELGYEDEEVLSAIRYHTTARPAMTLLEQITYVADLTSADRQFPDMPRLRAFLPDRIDETTAEILAKVMELMLRERSVILPVGLEAYNYYTMKRPEKGREMEDNE